jgi:hypothetical protein
VQDRPSYAGAPAPCRHGPPQSLTIAITIPATTNTTIATCIQIQVGDIA